MLRCLLVPAKPFPLTRSHLAIPAHPFPLTSSRLRVPAHPFPLIRYRCLLVPDPTGLSYSAVFNSEASAHACGEAGAAVALGGAASLGGLVNLTLEHDGTTATLTLSGPDGVWFGVGFAASAMKDAPYPATSAPGLGSPPTPAVSMPMRCDCARGAWASVCARHADVARRAHGASWRAAGTP